MPNKIPMTALGQNQNLINPIKISKIDTYGKPPGFYKSIVLDVIGILAAFFAGYAYFKFLDGAWQISALIGAFLLLIIVLALEALLSREVWRRIGVLIFQILALLLPFYLFDRLILAIAAVVAFILLLIGYLQSRGELNRCTTIRFFKLTHGVTAKAVTAALLVAVILYFPLAGGTIFFSESSFNGFFTWVAGLANNFYPAISFTGSFSDFAQSVAKQGLASNAAFEAMSPADQGAAISAAASQIETSLSNSFGTRPSATSSMSDVVYNAIEKALQELRAQFPLWFMVGWEISLFLVLRCIGVLVVWIGQFLTMIVYELLLASNIIHIAEEPQTKEVIEF